MIIFIKSTRRINPLAGFSMIELVTVLAIISISAGIAVPNILAWLPQYKLRGAANTIVTDMYYAKSRSASLNKDFKITFDTATEGYEIYEGNLSYNSTSWTSEKKNLELAHDHIDIFSVSTPDMYFTPTGEMTSLTLTLKNSQGNSISVLTSSAGRIETQ